MTARVTAEILWPAYSHPDDLMTVEAVPLTDRNLPTSTYQMVTRAAARWPDRVALAVLPEAAQWHNPVRYTYSQLRDAVDATAQLLHDNGIRRKDAVALMSPNCAELITATLAAQAAGIAAPINSGLASAQIRDLLHLSAARVLIAAGPELDAQVWATARDLAAAGGIRALFALRPTGASDLAPTLAPVDGVYVAYLSDDTDEGRSFTGEVPAQTDIASLFHTGGTTGAPKLAAHTHANEVVNGWMIAANSMLDDTSTLFAALPLFHVNALVVTVLAPMLRGQSVVWAGPAGYRDTALYAAFWKIVEHYRIAAMSAVPTVYSVLAQCPVDADISSLRVCIVGASTLPAAVRTGFEAHTGVPLLEGYGLTEATCASVRSFSTAPRPGSVGQRLPYQYIRAVRVDSDGNWHDVPVGDVGTIVISGPTVFPGYVVGRDEHGPVLDSRGKLVDGWLDTGDLGRVDADGFLYLTGRAKDLIIRGGHNIDPAQIEDALLAHPDVTGAAAVGRPDRHSGEVPVVYVTVRAGSVVTADTLSQWARENVAEAAAAPKMVAIVDEIPLTAIGKPYKLALRAYATHRATVEALHTVIDAERIGTVIEDGSVVAVIEAAPDHHADVSSRLDQYPIAWRIEVRS
ncbi:acyl-CoA synthetase [Nocardia goodfellowii]|uniref:Fatty-acyl-CoA synthase n=1 Tax=Nocardia goodfellowii TaxID=882446 RepID=A0ABS4QER9_9NOCA|nr:acyl-CoA synthetase [Nocardia goodfellowii]MBP2190206.1 fatty-acyl-CoA synthase [Nocardia goodfellowii]